MVKLDIESLLTKVFDVMDEEFLSSYVIMNKYDEVPYKLPSDLDICVIPEDFKRLDTIITKISQTINLLIVQKIWHGFHKCAYVFSPIEPNGRFRLQLDFFTDFSVKNTPLLISYKSIQKETRKYGRFTIPSYRMEYVFLLMRRIFKNDFDEEHFHAIQRAMNGDKNGCFSYLKSYFDADIADQINGYVEKGDALKLKAIQPILWKNLQNLSRKNSCGLYKFNFYLAEIKRKIFRIKYPVGLCVAFLSPDGGGKSSIYEKITDTCWGAFYGISKKYFRPHLLKNPGMLNPLNPVPESIDNPDPHGKKPNNMIKSLIRYFYYNLDFIIGYNILVRKNCIQKQLIVFDRYYYDYFVDLKRYQYSFPKWLPRIFKWTIPTPDIVFVLEGTPEVLYNRKKELSIDEIQRQLTEYRKLAKTCKKAIIINVDKSLDEVVCEVTRHILLLKARQTAKSMNIILNDNGIPL